MTSPLATFAIAILFAMQIPLIVSLPVALALAWAVRSRRRHIPSRVRVEPHW
jgi:hypothetical protein